MTENELVKYIHRGIHETNDLYSKLSGGWWITAYGIEGFLVGNVTRYIMKQSKKPANAFIELSFAEIYDDHGKKPKGPKTSAIKDTNRLDLALYNREHISHAVEFKRFWNDTCLHDIDRLAGLIRTIGKQNNKGSLRTGILALPVTAVDRSENDVLESLDKNFSKIEDKAAEYIEKEHLRKRISITKYYFSRGTDYKRPKVLNDEEVFSTICIVMK